ncbi:hypothetical protein [uncultured Limnobacter sp.]|jgi:hypothetical protein|uniref:hypothetical protein n=1 Tax=uncultured Limnobacter sp. TaxID=199681 RepID=UPI0032B22C27|tara:strand:+ start:30 stop:350 length:321 start_codon:yes stop_codon:yes gene_type:complete
MAGDWNTVVSEHQRTQVVAFYMALIKEFPILKGYSSRVWALGKARAEQWIHSTIPEQAQLGILVTCAVEVYPEETRRIVSALMGDSVINPIELGCKWAAVVDGFDA